MDTPGYRAVFLAGALIAIATHVHAQSEIAISGLEPSSGPSGVATPVTILGSFSLIESVEQAASIYAVYFGGVKADFDLRPIVVDFSAVACAGRLYVTAPPSIFESSTAVTVRVESVDDPSNFDELVEAYTYTVEFEPIEITNLFPYAGPVEGNFPVSIFGNFPLLETIEQAASVYAVYFGDVLAEFDLMDIVVDGETLEAVSAAGEMYVIAPPQEFTRSELVSVRVEAIGDSENFDGHLFIYEVESDGQGEGEIVDPTERIVNGWSQLLALAGISATVDFDGDGIPDVTNMQCFQDALVAGVSPALEAAFLFNVERAAADLGRFTLLLAPDGAAAMAYFATLSAEENDDADGVLDDFIDGFAEALWGGGVCGNIECDASGFDGGPSDCDSSCYDKSQSASARVTLTTCFSGGDGDPPGEPGEPNLLELCSDFDTILTQMMLLLEALEISAFDFDEDGLPELYALALVEYAACIDDGSAIWGATLNAHELNFIILYGEENFESVSAYGDALAVLMSISTAMQAELVLRLDAIGVTLQGEYRVVTCDDTDGCTPSMISGKSLREVYTIAGAGAAGVQEPFSGPGDFDGDGFSNAAEFLNVSSRGGTIDDFLLAAIDSSLRGTEFSGEGEGLTEGEGMAEADGGGLSGLSCFAATMGKQEGRGRISEDLLLFILLTAALYYSRRRVSYRR